MPAHLTAHQRQELGAFYTPAPVVAYMVGLLSGVGAHSQFLEPAGGDGAFVDGLVGAGVRPANIEVWDIDAKVRPKIESRGARFEHRDSLLDPGDGPPGGFTHVVGNPPYLNKHSSYIRENREELRRRYRTIGVNDTYALFIMLALSKLAPGGQLVFLVSDTFLTLGTHERLRRHLVTNTTIESITLLPRETFSDAGVNTAVISVRNAAPGASTTALIDCRALRAGNFDGTRTTLAQSQFAHHPGALLVFGDQAELLAKISGLPTIWEACDGGLGMFTRDNARYLGILEYRDADGNPVLYARPRPGSPVVPASAAGPNTPWMPYHKLGGGVRWWRPAEHCVRWDDASRAAYGIPPSSLVGTAPDGSARQGVLVSGVSNFLAARLATPGAMWESNKVFGLFPKDPAALPAEMLVAVLNSTFYARVAATLNHTVSLQVRDVKLFPLLPFTPAERTVLANCGAAAVEATRSGDHAAAASAARASDWVVGQAAARLT